VRSSDGYVISRDTDLAAQRHNRSVFVQRLRAHPSRAAALSGVFIALGIALLWVPQRVGTQVGILAALALGVAAWLLLVSFRRN